MSPWSVKQRASRHFPISFSCVYLLFGHEFVFVTKLIRTRTLFISVEVTMHLSWGYIHLSKMHYSVSGKKQNHMSSSKKKIITIFCLSYDALGICDKKELTGRGSIIYSQVPNTRGNRWQREFPCFLNILNECVVLKKRTSQNFRRMVCGMRKFVRTSFMDVLFSGKIVNNCASSELFLFKLI